MYFRERIEEIMADANLSDEDRYLLVDTLVPYVISYKALAGLKDDRIKEILDKIEKAGQLNELTELLEEKEENVDFTPTDNLDDNSLTMIH
jgi:hypothetical protein